MKRDLVGGEWRMRARDRGEWRQLVEEWRQLDGVFATLNLCHGDYQHATYATCRHYILLCVCYPF